MPLRSSMPSCRKAVSRTISPSTPRWVALASSRATLPNRNVSVQAERVSVQTGRVSVQAGNVAVNAGQARREAHHASVRHSCGDGKVRRGARPVRRDTFPVRRAAILAGNVSVRRRQDTFPPCIDTKPTENVSGRGQNVALPAGSAAVRAGIVSLRRGSAFIQAGKASFPAFRVSIRGRPGDVGRRRRPNSAATARRWSPASGEARSGSLRRKRAQGEAGRGRASRSP